MEKIIEDALTVQNCLPWLENDEDIINFMRKIPIDKTYLRIPITIKYFLNSKDSIVLSEQIEQDVRDIITILPTLPYRKVKKKLKSLGNIENRKEVLLRKFLNGNEDIDNVLNQMNHEMESRKRTIADKNEVIANTSKLSRLDDNIFGVFNNLFPNQNNNCITSELEKSVPPGNVLVPNKGVDLELQTKYLGPPLAEQVPEVFNLVPTIRETTLNEFKSNISCDPFMPVASTSAAFEPVDEEFIENNTVTSTKPDPPIISKAGPSRNNRINTRQVILNLSKGESTENVLNGTFIDLVENNIPVCENAGKFDEKLVLRLIEIFPEACPDYIRQICVDKNWSDFDNLVTIIIENEDHPKRQIASPPAEVDPEDQLETVKALLPDADPTYLRMKCEMLEYKPEDLNKFIIQAREQKDYPTMKEYIRNQQISAQSKQYTTEFSTEKFVQLFPEPHITFNDSKRVIELDGYSKMYITQYFHNKFDRLPKKAISNLLQENKFKILETHNKLTVIKDSSLKMKTRRKHTPINNNISNILVLQEIAYLEHKDEIESFLTGIREKEKEERQFAKDQGLMNTCQCCFDDEVMPKETFYCPKECLFCKSCIRKSCEIAFGEGRTNFKCLNECPEEFSLQTLQSILMPKMFSKIAQKKMIEEIQAAGIEDLEMCPFCDFASIPNEQDKIFKCLNPDCMKESCRSCKEPNHIPLRCDEIEKDENVKARVFIENKMTEALLCKCWKCGTSFFKEEGCNKMTCTCGAQMCYVCKKPVKDYTHFNGMGGDKYHLCPLYSDSVHLNQQKVLVAVQQAKTEIDQSMLKVDPSENLQQYYENHRKSLPPQHPLEVDLGRRHILFGRGRHRNH